MRVFLRSVGVGLLATGVDVAILLLLVHVAGITAAQANIPALLVGVSVQYFGNKYVAFGDRSSDHLRQGSLFAIVEGGTLGLNAVGFHLLVTLTSVPFPLARIGVALAVYVAVSFPLWRLIFRPSRRRQSSAPGMARD